MKFANIIFDFDGVIAVNAEQILFEELLSFLSAIECAVPGEHITARYCGMSAQAVAEDLLTTAGIAMDEGAIARIRQSFARRLQHEAEYDPGIRAFASIFDARWICSSGSIENICATLALFKMTDIFGVEAVFACNKRIAPKPAPDIYRLCLRKNALVVSQSLAVEDSVVGVEAARAAGLQVLGYIGGVPPRARVDRARALLQAGAICVGASFSELTDVITGGIR